MSGRAAYICHASWGCASRRRALRAALLEVVRGQGLGAALGVLAAAPAPPVEWRQAGPYGAVEERSRAAGLISPGLRRSEAGVHATPASWAHLPVVDGSSFASCEDQGLR